MADPEISRPAVLPPPVQIVSTPDVVALVEHCDTTIARLEAELVTLEDEVARAEARLRAHPAATVVGEEFERYVRGGVERHLAELQRGTVGPSRPVVTPTGPPQAAPAAVAVPTAAPAPPAPEPTSMAPAHAAGPPPDAGTISDRPRTEVPTRAERRAGRTRGGTTVVTRGTPPPPPAPPALREDATQQISVAAPVSEPAPVAAPADIDLSAEEAFWGMDVDASAGAIAVTPTRWPANLLVQLGIVLVIFAMILLKLG
jgi:hypothetical protein